MKMFSLMLTMGLVVALMSFSSLAVNAQTGQLYDVTITNVTRGQVITPPVVISHNSNYRLFVLGSPASDELVALAEDGVTDDLVAALGADEDVYDFVVSEAALMPGESVTLQIEMTKGFRKLSAVGMLATTNDGFFAVDAKHVFPKVGTQMAVANAYDAGSEANNESCDYIPGPPCEHPFVRATEGAEGYVSVHAGIHGIADLLPEERDWRNPVAEVRIQRTAIN